MTISFGWMKKSPLTSTQGYRTVVATTVLYVLEMSPVPIWLT